MEIQLLRKKNGKQHGNGDEEPARQEPTDDTLVRHGAKLVVANMGHPTPYIRGMYRRLSLLFAPLLMCSHTLSAQSFTQTIGGNNSQDGVGAMVAGAGYALGVREFVPGDGRHEGLVYAMSNAGGFESSTTLTDDRPSFLQGLANAQDGTAFLFGSVIEADAEHDALLVKLSTTGSVLWSVTPEAAGSQQYWGAATLPDGGAIVCGVNQLGEGHDVLIARHDQNGAVVWSHVVPGPTDAEAHGVTVDGNDIVVTGRQLTFSGKSDVLFMRLDLDGTVIWNTTSGGAEDEVGRSIISVGNSTFVMAGWTDSYGPFDETSLDIFPQAYLIAIDLDGDTLWTETLGDTIHENHAYAIDQAPNGDLFIAGERSTSALSDGLIQRLTVTGDLIWERTLDTGKEERLTHILPLADGLVCTGWSFGPFSRQVLFIRRNADGF